MLEPPLTRTGRLTSCVVLIGEIVTLLWAWHEGAPEEAAIQALSQAGDVDFTAQAALLKRRREVGIIDVVVVEEPDPASNVIMSV